MKIKSVDSRALCLLRRAIDEGRAVMRVLLITSTASSLEQEFVKLLSEVTPGRGIQVRVFVCGRTRALNPAIREQLFVIGREAVMNALRHSLATRIEVEVQYRCEPLRVFVRDNGWGIKAQAVQEDLDSHSGLRGMRERVETIGGRFGIWSKTGAGTEVRAEVYGAKRTTQNRDSWLAGTDV
jgi:signal transduction histidine kinase